MRRGSKAWGISKISPTATTQTRTPPSPWGRIIWGALVCLLLALYAVVLVRTAWLCDDIYITFRTVDNFVHGYGLRWNVVERVQSYTHPLWMFILSALYFCTRELFFSTLTLSLLLSLATGILLVTRLSATSRAAVVGIAVLTFSKAFTGYSSSGLENPLTHLLLLLFLLDFLQGTNSLKTLFYLSLVAGLSTLNRMDTLLLYLPALALVFYQVRSLKALGVILLGFAPFLVWECFSVIYYGFPFPNTAYAKLGTGITTEASIRQGGHYYLNSLRVDPLTLSVILLGLVLPVVTRQWRQTAIAVGMGLYLLYILKIGGDFMSGRFFAAPVLCAVALLVQRPLTNRIAGIALVVVVGLGFLSPYTPVMSGADYGAPRREAKDSFGIADERQYYYPSCGLLSPKRNSRAPAHKYVQQGLDHRKRKTRVAVHGSVGFRVFFAGPDVYIIDYYALTDPLLARMPAQFDKKWRIGHFTRLVPQGYKETVVSDRHRIADPDVASLYNKLCIITRNDLFTVERWKTILEMNTPHPFP
jgi:arabinofuranosyltransferase